METDTTTTREDQLPSASPEPTDDELRETQRKAREAVKKAGVYDLPPQPITTTSAARIPAAEGAARLVDDETWEPPCVTCRGPIGYRCKTGTYAAQTECMSCAAGSVQLRLGASGIAFSEIDQPLEGLKPHGADGKPYGEAWQRYMAFLRGFAALKPGQRMEPPFAFVCGSNGVGKSAGAQRALRDAIRNGCQGRFLRLSQILDSIYSTYGGDDETTAERMRFYATLHLLVIDEVGQETASDHAMRRFFDLVDDRYKNKLPTLLTSNYLPQADSLGAHIAGGSDDATRMHGILDRIRGGCGANVFVIRGASWRRAS